MLLFYYLKSRILKKKAMADGISLILNRVIIYSANSGCGFYINNLKFIKIPIIKIKKRST